MLYPVIFIPLAIVLLGSGSTWAELAIAFAIAITVGLGSNVAHDWIGRRTHRMTEPRTDRQSATLFAIGLGGALVTAYLLKDSHLLISFAAVCGCFFIGDMLGHALFGTQLTTAAPKAPTAEVNQQ